MKTRITTLRKIANRLGFTVYEQGQQWILSHRETEPLHYTVKTERQALLVGFQRAESRDLLSIEESMNIQNA
jgi:phosphopantetheine adenylyltransferase